MVEAVSPHLVAVDVRRLKRFRAEEVRVSLRRLLQLLLALLALPSAAFADRLHECLQATLVVIEPGSIRLQMNLTPGVLVAEQVLARMDRDRDGVISTNEAAAYADAVKRDLTVRLDGRKLKLKLTASEFPFPAEVRHGWGIIQLEFSATPGTLASGAHTLAFENRHLSKLSVYLINAAKPKFDSIQINKQSRAEDQSVGEIEFTFHPLAPAH